MIALLNGNYKMCNRDGFIDLMGAENHLSLAKLPMVDLRLINAENPLPPLMIIAQICSKLAMNIALIISLTILAKLAITMVYQMLSNMANLLIYAKHAMHQMINHQMDLIIQVNPNLQITVRMTQIANLPMIQVTIIE